MVCTAAGVEVNVISARMILQAQPARSNSGRRAPPPVRERRLILPLPPLYLGRRDSRTDGRYAWLNASLLAADVRDSRIARLLVRRTALTTFLTLPIACKLSSRIMADGLRNSITHIAHSLNDRIASHGDSISPNRSNLPFTPRMQANLLALAR